PPCGPSETAKTSFEDSATTSATGHPPEVAVTEEGRRRAAATAVKARILHMPGVRQRADERSRVSYGSPRCGAWRSLVSALVWGTKGREFESRRPDWDYGLGSSP